MKFHKKIAMMAPMLKQLRQGAIENPVFFRGLMGVIAVAFVISMGWFGFRQVKDNVYVAKVEGFEIKRMEYRRAYENAYRFYRNLLKDDFKEEELGKVVINQMVERQLWLKASEELGSEAGDHEIVEALKRDRSFFRKGQFDPQQYRFVLANSRPPLTPEQYESQLRENLSIDKTKQVIIDGIMLTADEVEAAKATVTDPDLTPEKRIEAENRAVRSALDFKKRRALGNFMAALRSRSAIEINDALL